MLLLICLLLPWPAAADAQPIASLTQATGEVMVRHAQTWTRAEAVPMDLFSGDVVSTDRGRAEVHFLRDDSTLVLDVGTQLTITESQEGTTSQLLRRVEIFLGDVWFQMKRTLNRKSEFVTPTAVGGLRGTQGLIHVEDETQSQFSLAEGELEITRRPGVPGSGAGPEPVTLRAGQVLHAFRNKPFEARAAASLPVRPNTKIPVGQLPKPREKWRELIKQGERPPTVKQLSPVSKGRAAQPHGQAAPVAPKDAPTTPPKPLRPPRKPKEPAKNQKLHPRPGHPTSDPARSIQPHAEGPIAITPASLHNLISQGVSGRD